MGLECRVLVSENNFASDTSGDLEDVLKNVGDDEAGDSSSPLSVSSVKDDVEDEADLIGTGILDDDCFLTVFEVIMVNMKNPDNTIIPENN